MKLHPVILSGGSGTRLWPLSRDHLPKQFLPLLGTDTMLQTTLGRLEGLAGVAEPLVVCNEAHRFLVAEQMRQIGNEPLQIIIEPVGRNTAPALTLAALDLASRDHGNGDDPTMLAMPADSVIRDVEALQRALGEGAALAEAGYLVALGVVPTSPATAYGYIRAGEKLEETDVETARSMTAFVEKPDIEVARDYVESGDWLWNSGIFMMKVSVWLSELDRHRADIARACRGAMSNGHGDGVFFRPGATEFIDCPSDSIDYAVMERAVGANIGGAARSAVVPLDAGWSDIGAWSTLWEEQAQDSHGNVIQGDVYPHSTDGSLLISQHRLLATVGLSDMVIVETADAVLVAKKGSVQDVKEVVRRLRDEGRTEHINHRKVHRPWGTYEVMDSGPGFQVKRLTINAGAAISLQKHRKRAEHWVVVVGRARVVRGDEMFILEENQSAYVPEGVIHRLENPGTEPLEIVEVQTGSYLGEDDIVRLDDRYHREHSD
jgi:mannose-1-phosphate guanylyltransferase / mannose-6-phosphate isomerase